MLPKAFQFKKKVVQHPKKKKVPGVGQKGLGPSEKMLPEFLKSMKY
jgi:hypothetical protein